MTAIFERMIELDALRNTKDATLGING